jgi:tRNA-splicing ligase RtcB
MQVIETGNVPIKAWVDGVAFEDAARRQVENVASLPFVFQHIAVMPDVHFGMGATVGSVIATKGAVIPAAVGVDIGCGMVAVQTTLTADQLPDSLTALRSSIERAVPVGGPGEVGSWKERGRHGIPASVASSWRGMQGAWEGIVRKHPTLERGMTAEQLGTLGTGNHFIEVCLDEKKGVWVMLHSGSRGLGNRVGTYFIEKARAEMRRLQVNLPDVDLAYVTEGSILFEDYLSAVGFAQDFARKNRELMLTRVLDALRQHTTGFEITGSVVNCHHNYVNREHHFGSDVLVTRKGAVRARAGELGIIPGSMGTRSYIVRGKGNPLSFESCSHGAGRRMSRTQAKRTFSLEDHAKAVEGVECRRDAGVIDETPGAYKPIDAVMEAQKDLVEVVHELKQVLCVKG